MAITKELSGVIFASVVFLFLPQYSESACICTFQYDPVCGSDGKTYSNPCLMACATAKFSQAIRMKYKGKCKKDMRGNDHRRMEAQLFKQDTKKDCMCPRIYEPVCGSDQNTYPNTCELLCQGLKIESEGPCPQDVPKVIPMPMVPDPVLDVPSCTCTRESDPVCGSDGKTYGNRCLLRCVKGVKVKYAGTCEEGGRLEPENIKICACPRIFDPVCGVDGITYDNTCSRECQGVALKFRGKCRSVINLHDEDANEVPMSICACTRNYAPVCASDGETYNNQCLMDCQGNGLYVVHEDECVPLNEEATKQPLEELQPCICPKYYMPVCGEDTDGSMKSYSNICELHCKEGVTKVNDGSCEQDENKASFHLGRRIHAPPSTMS